MGKLFKFIAFLIGLAGCGVVFALFAPNYYSEDRFITVSRGEHFTTVVDSLSERGVVASKFMFEIAVKIKGGSDHIQIGRYRFKSGMSNSEILEDLWTGKTVEWISVTIPEGFTAAQMAVRFARNLGIDSVRFLQRVGDAEYAHKLGAEFGTLEGYLMPSTYRFFWQADEHSIVQTMVDEFWKNWNDTMRMAAKKRNLTLHQVITMASIVEGETRIDEERPRVAGVYYNRLAKGMLLEADPTVQYMLRGGHRLLLYSDLKMDSPYNTYKHKGLPPGPVCNPGKAAIMAALYPEKHHYLFFVANGNGGHSFTTTYQSHLKAVRVYKKYRELRKIPGDAPRNSRRD